MVIELFIERGSNKTCNGMLMGGLLFVASDKIHFYAKVLTLYHNGFSFLQMDLHQTCIKYAY